MFEDIDELFFGKPSGKNNIFFCKGFERSGIRTVSDHDEWNAEFVEGLDDESAFSDKIYESSHANKIRFGSIGYT